jgi:hypothetical protein
VLTPALVELQAISARRSALCEGHSPVESRLIVIMVVEVSTPSPGYASWRLPVSPLARDGRVGCLGRLDRSGVAFGASCLLSRVHQPAWICSYWATRRPLLRRLRRAFGVLLGR